MDLSNSLVGNPAVLRRINQVRLLSHLRLSKGSSRVQMARETGLDPKTVTNLTTTLLQDGLAWDPSARIDTGSIVRALEGAVVRLPLSLLPDLHPGAPRPSGSLKQYGEKYHGGAGRPHARRPQPCAFCPCFVD